MFKIAKSFRAAIHRRRELESEAGSSCQYSDQECVLQVYQSARNEQLQLSHSLGSSLAPYIYIYIYEMIKQRDICFI